MFILNELELEVYFTESYSRLFEESLVLCFLCSLFKLSLTLTNILISVPIEHFRFCLDNIV